MPDMMMENESAVLLLDKITDFACSKAMAYASSGIDILSLGDDIGTQNSLMLDVELWERWLQPRLKRVIAAAKKDKTGHTYLLSLLRLYNTFYRQINRIRR